MRVVVEIPLTSGRPASRRASPDPLAIERRPRSGLVADRRSRRATWHAAAATTAADSPDSRAPAASARAPRLSDFAVHAFHLRHQQTLSAGIGGLSGGGGSNRGGGKGDAIVAVRDDRIVPTSAGVSHRREENSSASLLARRNEARTNTHTTRSAVTPVAPDDRRRLGNGLAATAVPSTTLSSKNRRIAGADVETFLLSAGRTPPLPRHSAKTAHDAAAILRITAVPRSDSVPDNLAEASSRARSLRMERGPVSATNGRRRSSAGTSVTSGHAPVAVPTAKTSSGVTSSNRAPATRHNAGAPPPRGLSEAEVFLYHQTHPLRRAQRGHAAAVALAAVELQQEIFSRSSSAAVSDVIPSSPTTDFTFLVPSSSPPPSPSASTPSSQSHLRQGFSLLRRLVNSTPVIRRQDEEEPRGPRWVVNTPR